MSALALTIMVALTASTTAPSWKWLRTNGNTSYYRAINPLDHAVKATIFCGSEYDEAVITIPAYTTQDIGIKDPNGGVPVCVAKF